MKALIASVLALTLLGAAAADAAVVVRVGGHHPGVRVTHRPVHHRHRVCEFRHHHRVCFWR